jgi:hypothetical protein
MVVHPFSSNLLSRWASCPFVSRMLNCLFFHFDVSPVASRGENLLAPEIYLILSERTPPVSRVRTRVRVVCGYNIINIYTRLRLSNHACVRTRARGLGVVHNSRIGVFADAGIRISVGHMWLLFGFLLNSRSHPATGK